jgi:pilus assembly protein CpaC
MTGLAMTDRMQALSRLWHGHALVSGVLFLAAALVAAPSPSMAQPRQVRIDVSGGQLIEFPRPARSVFIADPAIADIQVPSQSTVIVFGRKPGQTTLFAIGEDEKQLAAIQIVVGYEIGDLQRLVRQAAPNGSIDIASTPAGLVLSGIVPNADAAEKVRATVQRYIGEKDTLVNQLRVAGPGQVNLRVRVAEVARTVTKQLGFNWEAVVSPGAFSFGLATGRNAFIPRVGSFVPAPDIDNLISRATPLGTATTGANSSFAGVATRRVNVNTVIDALAEEGIVSILAEPNLTATSGEVASFLAGGEFPIPVQQNNTGFGATVTIEFKQFGVKLDFVPTVMSSERMSIKVRPEVSELSNRGAITLPGSLVIPALSVRRAETTVELGSGESFAIAGLIQNNIDTDISKYPGLGDIPILGSLFRSSRFQRNETELVIIVTPYVVRPVADGPPLKLPTDGLAPASDVERIFMDKLTQTKKPGAAQEIGLGGVRLRGNSGFVFE